jgi:hypothetical protein
VAIVPGNPSESELAERTTATVAEDQLPPPGSNKKLTPQGRDFRLTDISDKAVHKILA